MNPIRFGIVGGGWRTLFYLQVARELPDRFQVTGMVVRDAAKGQTFEAKWGVKTYRTLDELLNASEMRFMVVSVPRTVAPAIMRSVAERGIPVLTETPPAADLPDLIALYEDLTRLKAKVQVAEQYHLQPLHAARLAIARSGKLGTVTQAQVSAAHGYHGVSLIRKFLESGFEPVSIMARSFEAPLIAGPGRGGPPESEQLLTSKQVIAFLDFGGKLGNKLGNKLGIYDFTNDQYRSWIRTPRLLVRGERGEIQNTQVHYLKDFRTPITLDLVWQDAGEAGNLEGYYHKGVLAGSEWVYKNPYIPGRLSDDEIAVASCLTGMDTYIAGGPDFYSLAEAAQDHYLSLLIEQALASSATVNSEQQPWANDSPSRLPV